MEAYSGLAWLRMEAYSGLAWIRMEAYSGLAWLRMEAYSGLAWIRMAGFCESCNERSSSKTGKELAVFHGVMCVFMKYR